MEIYGNRNEPKVALKVRIVFACATVGSAALFPMVAVAGFKLGQRLLRVRAMAKRNLIRLNMSVKSGWR